MKMEIKNVDITVHVSARRNDEPVSDKFVFILERGTDLYLRDFPQGVLDLIELEGLTRVDSGTSSVAVMEKTIAQTLRDVKFRTRPGQMGNSQNPDGLMVGNFFQMYFYDTEGENAIYTGKIVSMSWALLT